LESRKNFSLETKKGGFREKKSLENRQKTQGSVVQVLLNKKNIFLFELENQGTKKPRNRWLNSDKELIYLSTVS